MRELSIAERFANTMAVETDINDVVELYEPEMAAYVAIDTYEDGMPVSASEFVTGCAALFKDLSYTVVIQAVASAAESPTKCRTYLRTADARGEFQSVEGWFKSFERCSTGASAALAEMRAKDLKAAKKAKKTKKAHVH